MSAPARNILLLLCSAGVASALDFNSQVKPVLEAHCIRCHNGEKTKGALRLDTKAGFLKGGDSGKAVVPGDLAKSELIRRITLPRGHEDLMPQEAEPLTGPHRNWLVEWVKSGAQWPDGVVLTARIKEVPGLADTKLIPDRAPTSLKDAAATADKILAKENAASKKLKAPAAPLIDDTAFLRRVSVDLIGRIPTTEEIAQYEKDSPSLRREKLLERLLKHDRFPERWTVFFADMIRIRSQAEGGPQLLAYVNRCISEAKPYDEMVRELISTNGRADMVPAAGFTLNDAVNPMALAGATAQIFLGVRISCAECHDHPFDDWKQKEFYQLAAFFGQSKRVEKGKERKIIFTTEGDESTVKWPPEREQPPKREDVSPSFPFQMISFKTKPEYIARLESLRKPAAKTDAGKAEALAVLDTLLSGKVDTKPEKVGADVLAESVANAHKLPPVKSIYRESEQRTKLAALITDPSNPYFARAFVNRVWAELVGRGFVEPLDNFSPYNDIRHPQTLQFLAQEFIASGYDFRTLVKMIMLTETYQRGHLPAGASPAQIAAAEESFTATRSRRMLGEVLFDSVATAGHLLDYKWPDGANRREVKRQVRVTVPRPQEPVMAEANTPAGTTPKPAKAVVMEEKRTMTAAPYDLEKNASLDFEALLKPASMKKDDLGVAADVLAESKMDLAMNKKADEEEAARMERARLARINERYRLETITEVIDDNPKFASTLRMATPAPAAHFLRVFGQPARDNLGEFRDEAPSLRQELMMLNGKAIHEASRVGPMEPIYKLITGPAANPEKAVELAYMEILSRRPSKEEQAEAKEIFAVAGAPADGISDLRWALLNSHEFRYLP
jgi:hypothetical protein